MEQISNKDQKLINVLPTLDEWPPGEEFRRKKVPLLGKDWKISVGKRWVVMLLRMRMVQRIAVLYFLFGLGNIYDQ